MTELSTLNLRLNPDQSIATVALARPDVRNAFNDTMIAELTQVFSELGAHPQLRCIVLKAEGTAFCAGADLAWMRRMADYSYDENLADAAKLAEMLRVMHQCPKPVVAYIEGDVYAGGIGLVAACDIALSIDSAQFCLSEVKLGLVPATISPYVVQAMGARSAHRYALTAERFSAAEALRVGLVHTVHAYEAMESELAKITYALCQASPQAVCATKRLLHEVAGQAISEELIAHTVTAIAQARASADGKEGGQAFLNKTKPSWLV
jgi:methylglutaconyl-CoA hydratase